MGERRPRWRARRRLAAVVVAVLALGGLAGCSDDAPEFSGKPIENPYRVPDTELVDTGGAPFSLAADTDRRLTLVFFGYRNCVDICPAVLTNLASALTRLDDDDREDVEVVMVTSDPDHDTPGLLRDYLDGFDTSFVGLTGSWTEIEGVGNALAVGLDRQDPGGHTTQVVGVDVDDQAPVYWDADTSPAQYAADIHTLLDT